ncbi:DUF2089 domain-containing protein [Sedimentibacter sp. zth1]|uniref:DUF2089 domain-containing protein n=1 Tax=Sedimentibacter sp. zth1 TaxID=2816908 RepID=UPI001A929C36|nr:DUF2089 domain-containing protein [Sedimentibacter sp. zth1]QSX07055.1 DUF2089 domain-containing protein [Sedimentibacter sp. zth1]
MKRDVIGKCPICNNELIVTELSCKSCKTKISGEFFLDKFCRLDKEKRYFAEIFIKNRGNIKEIEKELGISYPTVRKLLDEVIIALGYNTKSEPSDSEKNEVLEKLSKGEISSDEALKLISDL